MGGKGIDQSTRYFDIRGKRGERRPLKSEGLAKRISTLYPGMPPREVAAFAKENPKISNSALLPKLSAFIRHRHLPWYTHDKPPARLAHPPKPSQPTLAPKERALASTYTSLAPVVLRVPKPPPPKGSKKLAKGDEGKSSSKRGRKNKPWKNNIPAPPPPPEPLKPPRPKPSHLRADPRLSLATTTSRADPGARDAEQKRHEEVVRPHAKRCVAYILEQWAEGKEVELERVSAPPPPPADGEREANVQAMG